MRHIRSSKCSRTTLCNRWRTAKPRETIRLADSRPSSYRKPLLCSQRPVIIEFKLRKTNSLDPDCHGTYTLAHTWTDVSIDTQTRCVRTGGTARPACPTFDISLPQPVSIRSLALYQCYIYICILQDWKEKAKRSAWRLVLLRIRRPMCCAPPVSV